MGLSRSEQAFIGSVIAKDGLKYPLEVSKN